MKAKSVIRIQTRYQPDIHQLLTERAAQNNRSLNGELMEILKGVLISTAEQVAFIGGNEQPRSNPL